MAYKLEDGKWSQVSVDQNKVSSDGSGGSKIEASQYLGNQHGNSKSGADKSAQDKYNEVSYNICEGTLKPVVALPQMPSRVCLNVLGVGNMLSGKYYVKGTQLTVDKNGLTQTINVRKTEFGGYTRLTDDSRDSRPSPLIR